MTSTSTFVDFASRFRFIFAQFEVNNQSIFQLQQCLYLSKAIAANSDLVKAKTPISSFFLILALGHLLILSRILLCMLRTMSQLLLTMVTLQPSKHFHL